MNNNFKYFKGKTNEEIETSLINLSNQEIILKSLKNNAWNLVEKYLKNLDKIDVKYYLNYILSTSNHDCSKACQFLRIILKTKLINNLEEFEKLKYNISFTILTIKYKIPDKPEFLPIEYIQNMPPTGYIPLEQYIIKTNNLTKWLITGELNIGEDILNTCNYNMYL